MSKIFGLLAMFLRVDTDSGRPAGLPAAAVAVALLVSGVLGATPVSAGAASSVQPVKSVPFESFLIQGDWEHTDGLRPGEKFARILRRIDGTMTSFREPRARLVGGQQGRVMAAGAGHTCAVSGPKDGGGVGCWGRNTHGQLGDGTKTDRSKGKVVSGLTGLIDQVVAGAEHTCALTDGGDVWCWGANGRGQLGDGTVTDRTTPVKIASLAGTFRLAAGDEHTCAVLKTGEVRCFGANDDGQLGDGTTTDRRVPTTVVSLGATSGVISLSAGAAHSCAARAGARPLCWGRNDLGQLGNGRSGESRTTPVEVDWNLDQAHFQSYPIQLTSGANHTCAFHDVVAHAGRVSCWGPNGQNQIGVVGGVNPVQFYGPGGTKGDRPYKGVTAGRNFTCALFRDEDVVDRYDIGKVGCVGDNTYGQHGYAKSTDPVRLLFQTMRRDGKVAQDYVAVVGGHDHACVETTAGAVYCTGRNQNGQLGDGTKTDRETLVWATGADRQLLGRLRFHWDHVIDHWNDFYLESGIQSFDYKVVETSGQTVLATGTVTHDITHPPTTTSLAITPSPVTLGAKVKITATVADLPAISSQNVGTVHFYDGATAIGSLSVHGTNVATLETGVLAFGTHSITAKFASDYWTPSQATKPLTVRGVTTTTLSSNGPTPWRDMAEFTATVTSPSGTPGGTVTFTDTAGNVYGTAQLASGKAVFKKWDFPDVGTYKVVARYQGSDTMVPSTSAALDHAIVATSPVITPTLTPTTPAYGSQPALRVAVTHGVTKLPVTSGKVRVSYETRTNDYVIDPNTGTIDTVLFPDSPPGTVALNVAYIPPANQTTRLKQTQLNTSFTVVKATPTVALTVTPAGSAPFGSEVTIKADVVSSATPTGSILFKTGHIELGRVDVTGRSASLKTRNLLLGSNGVTAVYSGSTTLNPAQAFQLYAVTTATTTTTVEVSPTITSFGSPVTVKALVKYAEGTQDVSNGDVTFSVLGRTLGTAKVASGVAALQVADLPVGTPQISASYAGNATYGPSNGAKSVTVGRAPTTASVTTSPTSSTFGNGVTATATVTHAGGAPVTAGFVRFTNGATALGQASVNASGHAVLTFGSPLPSGAQTIVAAYDGTGTDFLSSQASTVHTVGKVNTATTLSATPNSVGRGETVVLKAQVTAANSTAVGLGSVVFTATSGAGSRTLGTVAVGGTGAATLSVSDLVVANWTVTAAYSHTVNFNPSSATASVAVGKSSSTTTVSASSNHVSYGTAVTVTATVAGASARPSGSVSFLHPGGTTPVTLAAGSGNTATASLNLPALPAGSDTIQAIFAETADFTGSLGSTTVTVDAVPVHVAFVVSPKPASRGQAVTLTATATSTVTPVGKIQFYDGSKPFKDPVPLSAGGVATLVTTELDAGDRVLTARFLPDVGDFIATDSDPVTETVLSVTATRVQTSPAASSEKQTVEIIADVDFVGGNPEVTTVELRDGTTKIVDAPLAYGGAGQGTTLAAWGQNACVVDGEGGVGCWGDNRRGQVGNGAKSTTPLRVPTGVTGLSSGVRAVAVGAFHACALTNAGGVKCWGGYGYLGAGETADQPAPVDVTGLTSGVTQISEGGASCALKTDGTVWCWGPSGAFIGDGTTEARPTPVRITGLPAGITAITGGGNQTCALDTGGHPWCWGWNLYGQLGDGTITDRLVPTKVIGLSRRATAIGMGSVGVPVTCAVLDDDSVSCWGFNTGTSLGRSDLPDEYYTKPTRSNLGGFDAGAVIVDGMDACVLSRAGTKVCNAGNETKPGLSAFAFGADFSCGVVDGYRIECSGANDMGQLADGTSTARTTYGPVAGGTIALARTRARHTTATLTQGTHTIGASFAGTAAYAASDGTTTHAVGAPLATTTTSLTASSTNVDYGFDVTYTATVTSTSGTPTGDVDFRENGESIGTAALVAGTATLTVKQTPGGHRVRAEFLESGGRAGSISNQVLVSVQLGPTTVGITAAPTSLVGGQSTKLTATVASTSTVLHGRVDFSAGAKQLGSVGIAGGKAELTTELPVGTTSVKATYSGFNLWIDGTATTAVTVAAATPSVTLTPSATHVAPGSGLTLAATVTKGTSASAFAPTGAVTLKDGATTIGTKTPNGAGAVTFTVASVSEGDHSYTASYVGDARFAAKSATAKVTADYFVGTEALLNVTTAFDQIDPAVAQLKGGGAIVVWNTQTASGGAFGIAGRILKSNGQPLAATQFTVVAPAAGIGAPAVAALADGGFVVAWAAGTGTARRVHTRRWSATGAAVDTAAVQVNVNPVGGDTPAVAGLDGGGYVVVWQSIGDVVAGQTAVMSRRWSAAGTALEAPVVAADERGHDRSRLGAGRGVGWAAQTSATNWVARVRRWNSLGQPITTNGATTLATVVKTAAPRVALAPLDGGGFIATWEEPDAVGATTADVRSQRFDAGGKVIDTTAVRADATNALTQTDPVVAHLAPGRVVLSWTSIRTTGKDVYAKFVNEKTGAAMSSIFKVDTSAGGDQQGQAIAPLGNGFLAVWASKPTGATDQDIRYQYFAAPAAPASARVAGR